MRLSDASPVPSPAWPRATILLGEVRIHASAPYDIADFQTLVRAGYEQVDRTSFIRDVETLGRFLLYIRDHLPQVTIRDSATNTFLEVLAAIRRTPHPRIELQRPGAKRP